MKKLSIIMVSLLVAMVVLVGCKDKNPEELIANLVGAMEEFSLGKIQKYVLVDDEVYNGEEVVDQGLEDLPKVVKDYLKENAKKIQYNIISSDMKKDTGIVKVHFKYVDAGPVVGSLVETYLIQEDEAGLGKSEDEYLKDIELAIKEVPESFIERDIDIPVKKIGKEWYVAEMTSDLIDVLMSNYASMLYDLGENLN